MEKKKITKKGKINIAPQKEPKGKNASKKTGNGRGDASRIEKWQWKEGQSGNPKGKPKGKTIKTLLREHLYKVARKTQAGEELTEMDEILLAHIKKAKKGNGYSTEILFDRLEGKARSGLLNPDADDEIGGIEIVIKKK